MRRWQLFFSPGRRAERAAARWLRRRGFTLVERNARVGRGEIDLVGLEADTVVFVEVRYRAAGIGAAWRSMTADKRKTVRTTVNSYRTRERLWEVPCRIDLVLVRREGRRWHVEHLPGAL